MELLIDYGCTVKLNSSRKNMWLPSYKVTVPSCLEKHAN